MLSWACFITTYHLSCFYYEWPRRCSRRSNVLFPKCQIDMAKKMTNLQNVKINSKSIFSNQNKPKQKEATMGYHMLVHITHLCARYASQCHASKYTWQMTESHINRSKQAIQLSQIGPNALMPLFSNPPTKALVTTSLLSTNTASALISTAIL